MTPYVRHFNPNTGKTTMVPKQGLVRACGGLTAPTKNRPHPELDRKPQSVPVKRKRARRKR